MVKFTLNGEAVTSESPPATPLLWVLREELQLIGTKFGCGSATRACVTPVTAVENRHVTTIEGLATPVGAALKSSWEAEQVPQCGYCQSGQIMQAATLLEGNPAPSDAEIVSHMNGHLCRCMAYPRIKRAIAAAGSELVQGEGSNE